MSDIDLRDWDGIIYTFARQPNPSENDPGGMTVSKTPTLPPGVFGLNEFMWPDMTLWFITEHEFTEAERHAAHAAIATDMINVN